MQTSLLRFIEYGDNGDGSAAFARAVKMESERFVVKRKRKERM